MGTIHFRPLTRTARRGVERFPVRLAALLAALAIVAAACTTAATSPSPVPTTSATPIPIVAPTPTTTPLPAFPLTLVDDEKTSVVIPSVPQKIVSLTPATTEILFAMGAGSRVVATTDFDDYPPDALSLPHVASYTSVDVEKIVGLGADLVIAGGNDFNPPDQIAKLRSLGIPVLVVYASTVEGVLHDIELVGDATGASGPARDLTAKMRSSFATLSAATAGLPSPRTFYEIDASSKLYTAADQSFLLEMLRLAGATPITSGSTTSYEISLETLVAADPELILLGDAAYGVTAAQVEARPGWGTMTAVKTGAIRPVDDLVVTRPGPRLVDGLRALILAIHPDLVLPATP